MTAKRTRKKKSRPKSFSEQVLSEDYWEGYYALSDTAVVKCTDVGDGCAEAVFYNLANGSETDRFQFSYEPDTLFSQLAEGIAEHGSGKIILRISDAAEQPDRDEAIDRILEGGESFELLRIQNLIRKLRSRGIKVFGGPIGGQDLFEDDYEGFYLLADGNILYCRDRSVWDEDMMDDLVDGVVSYYVLDPQKFSLGASKEQCYGSLRGDRFSDLAEVLYKDHGRVISALAKHGTELFTEMRKALSGDSHAAAVASHRLRINLCVIN